MIYCINLISPTKHCRRENNKKYYCPELFLQEPELLLLDEPANGLDLQTEQYMKRVITQIAHDSASTIVYVSHHPYEFGDIFEHCLMLEVGKIKACGRTAEIL